MNQQDDIRQFQQELLRLNEQLQQQQKQIHSLQQRLQALGGDPLPQPVAPRTFQNETFESFIGLRLIHLAGIIVLVTGLSIGVKYAIDRNLVSEAARILLAYAAGGLLYGISFRMRSQYPLFSAILFSGGMASLYFTTYAAHVYYNMMPFAFAFLFMAGLTAYTVYQALVYNLQEVSLLGLIGAYAIPFLISKNTDNPVLFFSYITLINSGVVVLGVKRPWRMAGRLAQAITWLLFIGWASWRYVPQHQAPAIFFLVLFFGLFFFSAIAPRLLRKEAIDRNYLYQLLFNNGAFCLAALMVMTPTFESSVMAAVITFCAVLAATQGFLFRRWKEDLPSRYLYSLAFLFFIAAVGLQWSGLTLTLLWLLMALVTFAAGVVVKDSGVRMAALVLMGITLCKLVAFDSARFTPVQKVISYVLLGILLLAAGFFYQRSGKEEK